MAIFVVITVIAAHYFNYYYIIAIFSLKLAKIYILLLYDREHLRQKKVEKRNVAKM